MNHGIRRALSCALVVACALGFAATTGAQAPKVIKISHQFPASSGNDGDFRDQMARKFAAEVEKRTNGQLKIEVYPNGSLVKTFSQFGAIRKGTLDMSVLPLAYGGGEVPEMNLGLMPALVTSYDQGLRWKTAPIGKEFEKILDDKGIKILTWVWQAGGIASKTDAIVSPDDAKGKKVRGGSKEMDLMIKGAGGAVTNVPSNEIYNAMSSGVLDAALTSSTSLISFRLSENAKSVTTARNKAIWFMLEPLVISKETVVEAHPRAAEGHGRGRRVARAVREGSGDGRRQGARERVREGRRQGRRHGRSCVPQVAGDCEGDGLQGLRDQREERPAAPRHGDCR